jgi:hypothetical protein
MRWPGSFFFPLARYTERMGPRIYTVREAEALLPTVEKVFADLDQVRARLRKLKSKMEVLEMLWGEELASADNPDHEEYDHYSAEMDAAKSDYEAAVRVLNDHEIQLKSVETGLIDFYGVIESRLVFLCWKRGESGIAWYHHLEDGFQGRKEILPAHKAV